jgi:glycosyltransferase involved in cell wall biosynthesis
MTDQPKISVHIIAYNQKDFIREAIDSALGQDYPNLEVVVADDGSSDGTSEIIADYARSHPGRVIAALSTKNLGITRNSNVGLRACSGEFIAFMGGDDVLLPGKIKAQAAWFAECPNRVLCGHQVEIFYQDSARPPHPLSRHLLAGTGAETFIKHNPFGATAVMVRASRIPPYGFDETLPVVSDQMLWVDVLREDGEFGFVPGTYARYRKHDANVTNDPLRHLGDVERHLKNVAERYPNFAPAVAWATTRRIYYDVGIAMMALGRKPEARRKFIAAICREPWFGKAWVRLAQSFT